MISNSSQTKQTAVVIIKLLIIVKIKVMTQTMEIKKDTWIKVNTQNKIQLLDKDQVPIVYKKCHKMHQVDQAELWTLELTCTSNLIIFNSNKIIKVHINKIKMQQLELETGNLSNNSNHHLELEWIKD